jgi:hypothetical protein
LKQWPGLPFETPVPVDGQQGIPFDAAVRKIRLKGKIESLHLLVHLLC